MDIIGRLSKFTIALLLTLVLAGILRFWNLEKYPVGFTPDEASFGYDAYSLLKTGKDQWGASWPIILKSFGDFKAPVYSYLTIPSVAIFGLNKIAVRLPNAIVGILAVLFTYLLVKELFSQNKKDKSVVNEILALSSAFLLAINSWHIMLSRGAFEANLTTLFLPFGIFLLLKGFNKRIYLYLGTLVLGLNMFTYHAAKLVTPAVLFSFIYFFRDKFFSINKKQLFLAGGIFLVFLGATVYSFSIGAGARVGDVSIFKGIVDASAQSKVDAYALGINPALARILYSKFEIPVIRFLENYVTYFSPQFLFTRGPAEATYGMIPGRGVLYWFELPFLVGFLGSLFKSENKKVHLFILSWLMLAPIPASLTTGPGFAGNRAETMIPALQTILGVGLVEVCFYFKNHLKTFYFKATSSLFLIFSVVIFAGFLADYFLISPARNAQSMLSGDLEVSQFLKDNLSQTANIIVSRSLSEPQIYIAFANKWNPVSYQNATINWNYEKMGVNWVDQIPEYKLGNYTFKGIDMNDYKNVNDVYIVGKPGEFPDGVKTFKTIYFPNKMSALLVVKSSDLNPFIK